MSNLSSQKRDRILVAAAKLFDTRDFDDVRMEDIAQESGIGKVTLYRYFPSKDALQNELLRGLGREFLDRIRVAERSERGCKNRLTAIVREALDYFDSKPKLLGMLDKSPSQRDGKDEFPWREVQLQVFDAVKRLLAEGVARREFDVDDLDVALRALLGAVRFQIQYPLEDVVRDKVPASIVSMMIRPLGPASAATAA